MPDNSPCFVIGYLVNTLIPAGSGGEASEGERERGVGCEGEDTSK